MVEIQMIIINEFGEFYGRKSNLPSDSYGEVLKMARNFYSNGSFDLTCEDGSFMVFAPAIVAKSILKINKRIIEEENV